MLVISEQWNYKLKAFYELWGSDEDWISSPPKEDVPPKELDSVTSNEEVLMTSFQAASLDNNLIKDTGRDLLIQHLFATNKDLFDLL